MPAANSENEKQNKHNKPSITTNSENVTKRTTTIAKATPENKTPAAGAELNAGLLIKTKTPATGAEYVYIDFIQKNKTPTAGAGSV